MTELRILINAVGISMGGGLRHLKHLVRALDELPTDHELSIMVRNSVAAVLPCGRSRIIAAPAAESALQRLAFDLRTIPKIAKKEAADVLVSLANFGPLSCTIPHVVFQRNALFFCESSVSAFRSRLDLWLRRLLVTAIISRADLVVVPSRAMKDLLLSAIPALPPTAVRVLHHAHDPVPDAIGSREFGRELRIIYPVHGGAHKHHEEVFEILSRLRACDVEFSFRAPVRKDEWTGSIPVDTYLAMHDLSDRVSLLGSLSHEEMERLYAFASVMLYSSRCESFGFPLVEAMAVGLPIVAVDTAVNREICGDSALYYSAGDVDAAVAMLTILRDRGVAEALSKRALARSRTFPGRWSSYAAEFVNLAVGVASTERIRKGDA